MWAEPAVTPSMPRPSDQPPALPLEGVGGGSERHSPLATVTRHAPCPPTVLALPGVSERRDRKLPELPQIPWTLERRIPLLPHPRAR